MSVILTRSRLLDNERTAFAKGPSYCYTPERRNDCIHHPHILGEICKAKLAHSF